MNAAGLVMTLGAIVVLFVMTEVARARGAPTDATRTAAHMAGGAIAALFPLYLRLADVLVIGILVSAVLTLTALRGGLRSIHEVERRTVGAVALPVGATIAALILWPAFTAFAYAMLVLGVADAAAAIAGRAMRSPSWRVIGGTKSLAGSTAFCLVAIAAGLLVTPAEPLPIVAAALAVTALEALLGYGLDDLAIPIAAGLVARTYLV